MSENVQYPHLDQFIETTAATILNACTLCGRCVEVCPVVPFTELVSANPQEVVAGVHEALRGRSILDGHSAIWAQQCNGCGLCIPECPEGVNPRQMVMLANAQNAAHYGSHTPQLFRKMARAIRLMAAMQLIPEEMRRLLTPPRAREVEVVFYTGCNAIRTPNVLFNAMFVLDALNIDYEVLGGPAACCGIIHSKWEGEINTGGKVSEGALRKFGDFQPSKVLNWCPSCELHLNESIKGYRETSFDFDHITKFLLERQDQLKGLFNTKVDSRVLLHAHEGMQELGDNVAELLKMVPGLTLVDTVYEPGYTCGGSGADRSPALKAHRREETIRRAMDPAIDVTVSLYHGCHAQLAAEGRKHGFQVTNFTDILVRALGGTPHEDTLEALSALSDWKDVALQAAPQLLENGIAIDPEILAGWLPELFTLAEFKGGLKDFASH